MSEKIKPKVIYRFTDEFRIDDMVSVLKRAGAPTKDVIARWRAEEDKRRETSNSWLLIKSFRKSKVA